MHYKDNNGTEFWNKYDDKGNLIHFKDNLIESWHEYDSNGNEISYKDSNGNEYKTIYTYFSE